MKLSKGGLALKGPIHDVRARLDSHLATYAIVSFGLLLRMIALARVGGRPLSYESPAYYEMALEIASHVKFSPYWPPGVPYYLLFFHKVFGDGMLVARASILPVYAGFSFALYALTSEISSRRAGNLAVLAFALYPSYIRNAFNPSTEYPAAACLVAVVYLSILAIRRPSYPLSAALGLLLGALALVRPNSLGLAIVAPAYLFFRTCRPALAAASLLVSSLLISAWLWKAHNLAGRFVMINDSNAQNFFFSNNPYTPLYNTCPNNPVEWEVAPQLTEMEQAIANTPPCLQQTMYRQIALGHILSRPDLFLLRTFNRFRAYFCFPIHRGDPLVRYFHAAAWHRWLGIGITIVELCFYWPIMILAIIFCFNLRSFGTETHSVVAVMGAAAIYAFPCWLTCSQPRYNFPVVPLFAVLAFALLEPWLDRPWSEVLEPIMSSDGRRRAMLLTLAFFLYIQIEWIAIVASN